MALACRWGKGLCSGQLWHHRAVWICTGLSVALCVFIALGRLAYLVANIARRAVLLPFLSYGIGCCYALGCTNCLLTCRSASWRYMEQRLKTLFPLIADVLTNEPFKKHVTTFALPRLLLLPTGGSGVGAVCAMAQCGWQWWGWAATAPRMHWCCW